MDTPMQQPMSEYSELPHLQKAILRQNIRKVLGVHDIDNYFLLRWILPTEHMPDDGSYVLIKFLDDDGQTICSCPACYEGRQFRDLFEDDLNLVINPVIILGWSYYPYDDRSQQLI